MFLPFCVCKQTEILTHPQTFQPAAKQALESGVPQQTLFRKTFTHQVIYQLAIFFCR